MVKVGIKAIFVALRRPGSAQQEDAIKLEWGH
jgi:hypothetical protein